MVSSLADAMTDIERLQTAIRSHWPNPPTGKALPYVGRFFNRTRTATKIVAKVKSNHGDYTMSIAVGERMTATCSPKRELACLIGITPLE